MKKLMIGAVCAMMAAVTFAEPSVEITKAWQQNPGKGIVNYTYTVSGLEAGRSYDLSIKVGAEGCDKTATIKAENVTAGSVTTSVDTKTLLGDAYPNVTLYAELNIRPATVPTDANGFDTTVENTSPYCSTTFVPGDYCVVDLKTGAVTEIKNVQYAGAFNTPEYKTTKMAFRWVPAGKFKAKTMRDYGYNRGTQAYDVELSAYWIAVFPVTVAQFNAVMGGEMTNVLPQATLSWNAFRGGAWNGTTGAPAKDTFVAKLNELVSGSQAAEVFDLCTLFQWERAARAGTRTDYFFSEVSAATAGNTDYKALYDYAWFANNSENTSHPVGEKLPNAWGLYDVYGNVFEWSLNYHENLTGQAIGKDYGGPTSGSNHDRRGGGWASAAGICSSINRDYDESGTGREWAGFRLVRRVK